MTEKRFTQRLYETGERFLEDNKTNCFYEIKDSFENVELLCERLNKIVDENEQLKQENKKLHNTIFALRTENAYDRVTEITKQKDMNVRDFLEELDKW